eukprot:m.219470 g.219470  ORF g.219470 m.219470 type:complete len:66 (+) comp17001_c1_seq11:2599-2796(+)
MYFFCLALVLYGNKACKDDRVEQNRTWQLSNFLGFKASKLGLVSADRLNSFSGTAREQLFQTILS